MECCGLQERKLNGDKCQNAIGSWQSVYARFRKWQKDGVWEKIFHTLSSDADMENLSIDSTMAKAHQSTNGGFKKGQKNPSEEHVEG